MVLISSESSLNANWDQIWSCNNVIKTKSKRPWIRSAGKSNTDYWHALVSHWHWMWVSLVALSHTRATQAAMKTRNMRGREEERQRVAWETPISLSEWHAICPPAFLPSYLQRSHSPVLQSHKWQSPPVPTAKCHQRGGLRVAISRQYSNVS